MTDQDRAWMLRALELAARGRGAVEPNPMVGAVVVKEDRLVADGAHERHGGPHAEVIALERAAGSAAGATLYVSLEPCCHHGKTPPCTNRILASGVARVVVAMCDPYEEVSGKGIERLREAGIAVEIGCEESAARSLNAPYLKLISTGRPYVHAKWAMTLDGRIATVTGQSQWISNETSRAHAHTFRGQIDAIIVGLGTVLADDPQLTARPPGPRTPARVVLDSQGRLPLESNLVRTARAVRTIVVAAAAAPEGRLEHLERAGCECIMLPRRRGEAASTAETPQVDERRAQVGALLDDFGRRRWTNVLVEGGPTVLASFLAAGEIDAVRIYLAPRIVGGAAAPGPVGGTGIARLADSLNLGPLSTVPLDGDLFVSAQRP